MKKNKRLKLFTVILMCSPILCSLVFSQNIGINTTGTPPDNAAMLDIAATNKGLLIPRVSLFSTTDVSTIPSPTASLLVYNTNASMTNGAGAGFYYYTGSVWTPLLSGAAVTSVSATAPVYSSGGSTPAVSLQGNAGTLFYGTGGGSAALSAGASGQLLRSKGAAAPAWTNAAYPDSAGTAGNVLTSDGTNWVSQAPTGSSSKFGGDSSDGALNVSSGTTTIDLGAARLVVKNYSSISITGTGKVVFTNPNSAGSIVILRSKGNVTLTSSQTPMLDASGCGIPGAGGSTMNGNNSSSNVPSGTGGAISAAIQPTAGFSGNFILNKYPYSFVGGGGSGGGWFVISYPPSNSSSGGDGGNGGGCLIVECAGAWNFTTANGISVAGKNGTDGVISIPATMHSRQSAGGGGGGGFFCALYNTLTSNSGTVNVSGGTGGNNSCTAGSIMGGGGGGSATGAGGNGSNAGNGGQGGGNGATGISLIMQNTEY